MGRPLVGPQPQPRHGSQQLLPGHRCGIEHHGRAALDASRGHPPGLVPQADADRYVEALLHTIGGLLDRAKYLPPRNVDWITLKPSLLPEESSVDAAFMTLALYQYKSLPSTSPALRTAIDQAQNRFDFSAFSCPDGWRMAYRYLSPQSAEGFVRCVYDGYTNEGNLTSLAAQLSSNHRVPIETHWNTSIKRARMQFAGLSYAPMVHQLKEFRAPFTQALWNLFVDVRQRALTPTRIAAWP